MIKAIGQASWPRSCNHKERVYGAAGPEAQTQKSQKAEASTPLKTEEDAAGPCSVKAEAAPSQEETIGPFQKPLLLAYILEAPPQT